MNASVEITGTVTITHNGTSGDPPSSPVLVNACYLSELYFVQLNIISMYIQFAVGTHAIFKLDTLISVHPLKFSLLIYKITIASNLSLFYCTYTLLFKRNQVINEKIYK